MSFVTHVMHGDVGWHGFGVVISGHLTSQQQSQQHGFDAFLTLHLGFWPPPSALAITWKRFVLFRRQIFGRFKLPAIRLSTRLLLLLTSSWTDSFHHFRPYLYGYLFKKSYSSLLWENNNIRFIFHLNKYKQRLHCSSQIYFAIEKLKISFIYRNTYTI